jgi:leucyl aminopeptidase (aminopeptidase T)
MAMSAASFLVATAPATDAPSATYQPDWPKLAQHMVQVSLKLAPGERVIIHYDPARDPGLVAALRTEITRAGGIVSGELTWPDEATGKYLESLSPAERKKRGEAETAVYRELFANSDVYLWLHAPAYEDLVPREFEHLIGESKVRAIHSHWFEPQDPVERDAVRRMYERAIEMDPAQIEAVLAPMEAKLRGAKVHLTSPEGTDLTFQIPKDAWFHHNTGEASRQKVATARSVRDREEELPAGVLRTTDVADVEGKLVATVFSASKDDAVTVTFRNGRIVKVEPHGGAGAEFAKWYDGVTGDRDKVSELVIGANPNLTPIQPSGFMPYYGYGAGAIRIAVGENWESGGALRTSDHQDWWLYVTDGTLTASGAKIVNRGALGER